MVEACTAPLRRKAGPAGQGLVEYGLISCLVAVVVIAILVTMGPQVGSIFSSIGGGNVANAVAGCTPRPQGHGQGLAEALRRNNAGWCP